jgi:hypothetical protein
MIFRASDAPTMLCPTRSATKPTPCAGCKCTAWRWIDTRTDLGSCGLHRDPLEGVLRDRHGELHMIERGAATPVSELKRQHDAEVTTP